MWRAVAIGVLALSLLAVPTSVQAQSVVANCDFPSARDGCDRWYRTPWVTVSWDYAPGGNVLDGCDTTSLAADAPMRRDLCEVQWAGTTVKKEVWFGIDRTPPQVVAIQPTRPPDYGAWFNHPVAVGFRGSDTTSGVRACSSAVLAGPDGAGVPVAGTCTDVAGNTGGGTFRLNYDATPPGAAEVSSLPGNRRVALSWSPPTDAVLMQVARITGDGSPDLVYQGAEPGFTDRGLRNGKRYRYIVTSIDRAGNRADARGAGVPTSRPLLTPAMGARVGVPPLLLWKPVKRASYYNVQLYKGRRKILTRWPRAEQLQLGKSWRFAGRKRLLGPGVYEWFVFPGFGDRSKRRYGKLLGSSKFTVTR